MKLKTLWIPIGIGVSALSCHPFRSTEGPPPDSPHRVVVKAEGGPYFGISENALRRMEAYKTQPQQRLAYYNLGRAATPQEISAWDIDISPDGHGLPEGSGTAVEGKTIYAHKCAMCHGTNGEGVPPNGALVSNGSNGKTIGSYWPYATTIFDYVRRAMPFANPGSLTNQETYSLTAFLLYKNGIINENTMIDANSLPRIQMPNTTQFIPDDREWHQSSL